MLTTIRNSELTAVIDSAGAQLISLKDVIIWLQTLQLNGVM